MLSDKMTFVCHHGIARENKQKVQARPLNMHGDRKKFAQEISVEEVGYQKEKCILINVMGVPQSSQRDRHLQMVD